MIASFPTPLRLRSPFRCPRPLFPRDDGGRRRRGWASRCSMCLAAAPFVKDGALRVNGREALTSVPQNVVVSPPLMDGAAAFLGAVADREDSRHVFKLGVLRFKIWWMIPRMGTAGSDVPIETQMLLLEARQDEAVDGGVPEAATDPAFYILFLPVLDGDYRSSLQGNSSDELEFCIESGRCLAAIP
ncbi:hypothetical protein GW17_00001656 [Ensete ventricosum]|nr:hypothetical protein GW17_00001656 [Ensete ventricosum]